MRSLVSALSIGGLSRREVKYSLFYGVNELKRIQPFAAEETAIPALADGSTRQEYIRRFRRENDRRSSSAADYPNLEVRPDVSNVIQQTLQYGDKSPAKEAEPYDHHRYDECG